MNTPFDVKRTTDVGRSGFDMSQRHLFNAMPGALIPVMCEETLPGDTHRINLSSFTRMRNLNTAAFARFKEYFDFFWVPMDTLWPYFNGLVVNNNEPMALPSGDNGVPSKLPFANLIDIYNVSKTFLSGQTDEMGLDRFTGFRLLADMLGFGFFGDGPDSETPRNIDVNLLSFAFYQQIYANYYRNPQWERRDVHSYNLNAFYNTANEYQKASYEQLCGFQTMFKLRYANWHKDYFMGLYPTQQFGDVSVASLGYILGDNLPQATSLNSLTLGLAKPNSNYEDGTFHATARSSSAASYSVDLGVSIVELRRAQALQRWKEVTLTNGSSMFQQVKAHYGFELPEGRKNVPEYVGGLDNVISINDIDATAAGANNSSDPNVNQSFLGQVGGKGLGVSDPSKTIEFTSKDFGLLMCVYHVEPILDYNAVGIKKFNQKMEAADFYLPEFDKIGFGALNASELFYDKNSAWYDSPWQLGFTSRYLDYKASYDRVHGSFITGRESYKNDTAWVVAITEDYLNNLLNNKSIDYRFFKVSPYIANNIMVEELEALNDGKNLFGVAPFMVAANFKYYKSSNMSVDSLPY